MPAAGFRRLGLALLAVVSAGAVALTSASLFVSADFVRDEALREIRDVTGLEPILGGDTTVSLFPSGTVSFDNVMLGDASHPALKAERLTARLRFFPLLAGRVEIADVSLERPTIAIDIEADGRSNWSGLIEALARSQKPGARREAVAFSEMRIDNGTVHLRNAANKISETLHGVELSLAWPSISKSFGASGRFIWHDESMDASLTLADFVAALSGARTGLKLRVAGAPMKAAFEGSISVTPTLRVEGTLAADSPSLRQALVWAGQKPLPGGGFGRFAIKAQTNIVGGTIGLTGVNLELDGNTAEGVLTYVTDGRQTLQGTLAAEALDLSPYVSTMRLLTTNQRAWNSSPIGLDGLSSVDIDLRLSAGSMTMSNARIGRTAIAANLRGGHLVVTVGEAQAYGGVIKGSLALAGSERGVDMKSQFYFADVDLESCLGQLFGLRRLEGRGNISVGVEGTGGSVLAVTRTLDGNATLVGNKGALAGLDVEQLLRRLERRPLSGGGEFRTGRTAYEKITVGLTITQGTVNVEDVTIEGPAVRLGLNGSASIPARELDLKGTAALIVSARPGATPFELPFIVQGSWDDPIMLPDPEALIRRSGAAAPLLNATRGRNASGGVRSALERLRGSPSADAVPAAEQAPAGNPR